MCIVLDKLKYFKVSGWLLLWLLLSLFFSVLDDVLAVVWYDGLSLEG